MMRLSILVGVFLIILANLVSAWRRRTSLQVFAPLGWVMLILGGLLAGFKVVGSDFISFAVPLEVYLLSAGAAAILLFSSERPLSLKPSAIAWRMLDGLQRLTGLSKAFGDILSYLRLFALGLASAQLAVTFNEIAAGTMSIPGVGLLVAILILVVGHGLNFILAVIGGVVHGLRLNCIEFLDWSLSDEGYPFQAFCKKAS